MSSTLELSELDAKIGQLFMAGIPGTEMDKETESLIRDYNLGGIILFARNIENPVQLATMCRDLQERSTASQGLPLLISIDQEGGRVARLQEPFTRFPGNAAIGRDDDPEAKAREFGSVTAGELKLVGINMDMAPVVDVQQGELEQHLADRIFGEDPLKVAMLGKIVIEILQKAGVLAVAKHFPGLGRADLDPHVRLPRINIDMQEMEDINLPPFKAAIEAGVSAVMTSHAIYPALDPDRPGTLSEAVLTQLLRKKMAFDGLIITDDLEMGAIEKHWGVAQGAAMAFEAGADILLICKDQQKVRESIDVLKGRLLRQELPFARLQESVDRIVAARKRIQGQAQKISLAKVKSYFKLA